MAELASPRCSPLMASSFSSPTMGFLLSRRVLAWSQKTGLPPSVRVRLAAKTYHLHKSQLILKSGYFGRALKESTELDLPGDFPGGSGTFEKVALFIYGSPTPFDASTVAAARCAAEFLEMTEDLAAGNLCERSDLFLNQVILQSWADTLSVLERCRSLLPWSERLLIVSRCVESLSFMACMEILDPEQRGGADRPAVTLQALASRPWSCDAAAEIAGRHLWIRDLIALPFNFFKRIVGSLRRQGMKEMYVSPLVVFYANKWLIITSEKAAPSNSGRPSSPADPSGNTAASILEGVIELLPAVGEKAATAVPVGFYFALLARALRLGVGDGGRTKLQKRIAALLHTAQVGDFLLPDGGGKGASGAEVEAMRRIFSIHASSSSRVSRQNPVVAELWDRYLNQIASDEEMSSGRFMDLIEVVPHSDRDIHDHLYEALSTFLRNKPELSGEEKASVARYLDCRKLSEATCIKAVRNEQMPLRLVVQALLVQQLSTQQAFRQYSGPFGCIHAGDPVSGSLSASSRFQSCDAHDTPLQREESPFKQPASEGAAAAEEEEAEEATGGASLAFLLRRDLAARRATAEYESTSFRIQTLEQELRLLRRSLQRKGSFRVAVENASFRVAGMEGKTVAAQAKKKKKKKDREEEQAGRGGNCIASVRWGVQRKCARRLLKILRKMAAWGGGGRSKTKQAAAGGQSDGSTSRRSSQTVNGVFGP